MKTHLLTHRSRLPAPADEAYRWHSRPGAFERLNPPWDPATVVSRTGGIEEEGSRLHLRVGPLHLPWIAEHRDAVPGRRFRDVQVQGPFAHWVHDHLFEPDGPESCWLADRVEYALPAGRAGDLLGGRAVARMLKRLFTYRHRTTADDLAAHAACRGRETVHVLVTGSSGLLGSALVPFLTTGGHEVTRLVRRPPRAGDEHRWDPAEGTLDPSSLEGADAIVHLSGEGIADGRWTAERKARLRTSRIEPTRLLVSALSGLRRRPRVLVAASAIGCYGDRGDAVLTEESDLATDFLGQLSRDWEAAAAPAAALGVRVVHLRFGIVLSPGGGALARMLPPFRLGVAGRIGSGRQYVSWIALDDALGAIHHALVTDTLAGPVNAVAPRAVTNEELTRTLGRVLRRPTIAPLPAFAARLAFGEMADPLLLASTRVAPERLLASGYRFRHPELEGALRHLLGRPAD